MDDMAFTDALTGHVIAVSADGGAARVVEKRPVEDAPSVFFPGCSMVNYAPALVSVMADYLAGAGIAQGVSLLCCGKILDFEEGGAARRDTVDEKMREAFARAGRAPHRCRVPELAPPRCDGALAAPGAPAIEVVPLSRALAMPAAGSKRGPSRARWRPKGSPATAARFSGCTTPAPIGARTGSAVACASFCLPRRSSRRTSSPPRAAADRRLGRGPLRGGALAGARRPMRRRAWRRGRARVAAA